MTPEQNSEEALRLFLEEETPFAPDRRVLVIRAHSRFPLPGEALYYQTFKPDADRMDLEEAKWPEVYDGCILVATKHKEENLFFLAKAALELPENSLCIVTAANELGAASLEKEGGRLFGNKESYSKRKSRVVRFRKTVASLDRTRLEKWLKWGEHHPIEKSDLVARPGMFSWKKLDKGSQLLMAHLEDEHFSGVGADLGAGYGYLSRKLLERSPEVERMDLYEAEALGLEAAEANLASFPGRARFFWHDVTTGVGSRQYDFILSNPPFHTGKTTDIGLGQGFLKAAATGLKPGGKAFFVANAALPYEREMARLFPRWEIRFQGEGFKILYGEATR